jgi:predicted nucleotidyltransferase
VHDHSHTEVYLGKLDLFYDKSYSPLVPAPSRAQSHVRFPLTSIFGSAGNVRVLRALAADRSLQSVPQLSHVSGLSPQGVRLVLDTLARQQLVKSHGAARARLYALDESHPFSGALVSLFHEEQQRWERLLATIRERLAERGVRAAWLYGSVARGEDTPRSDLDIALLVSSGGVADHVREDLTSLENEQQVHISLTALTPKELAALPDDDRWWSDVVRDARVLKGSAPEAAKRHAAKAAA